jgi:hypothetical protein
MMSHDTMNDDALSLSMFWAGALMVFTPMIGASIVLSVWWWKRRRRPGGEAVSPETTDTHSVSSQASGVAIRPT